MCVGSWWSKNINVGLGGNMQKRDFHPTFLLFERPCVAEKNLAYSAARKVSPLMLINFWTVMFQKSIHGQFVDNSWTLMFQKNGPFVLPFFLSSSLPLFDSSSFCLFVSSSFLSSASSLSRKKRATAAQPLYYYKCARWVRTCKPQKPWSCCCGVWSHQHQTPWWYHIHSRGWFGI